jgi:hypothetical protein
VESSDPFDLADSEQSGLKKTKSQNWLLNTKKYQSVDGLFGKTRGIERVLLCERSETI